MPSPVGGTASCRGTARLSSATTRLNPNHGHAKQLPMCVSALFLTDFSPFERSAPRYLCRGVPSRESSDRRERSHRVPERPARAG